MKKLQLCILALCAGVLFQGCDGKSGATATGTSQKKLRLAFVGVAPDNYWAKVRLGCDYGVRQLGDVDFDFRFPATRTAAAQQEILTALVASGVDGIILSPIDADQQTEFLNGIATNTLLICAGTDADKSQRTCFIGTDNIAAGTQAAELIKAALPEGGKIILFVGYPNAQNTKDRLQGIEAGLAGSNIQIIETLADEHSSVTAHGNVQAALVKHPEVAGMVGIYAYHGPVILNALRGAGKAGQVKIVCFDEDSETLSGIVTGEVYGTVVQNPLLIGAQTVLRTGKYLRGDKTQLAGGKILFHSRPVTKAGVEALQNLLKDDLKKQVEPE